MKGAMCHVVCLQSGAALQRVDSDEHEVRRLEKLLGMNRRKDKNKLPASFAREGLDCIYSHLFVFPSVCLSVLLSHTYVQTCTHACSHTFVCVCVCVLCHLCILCLDRVADILSVTRPGRAELSDDEDHVWLKAKRAKVDHQKVAVGSTVRRDATMDAGVESGNESGLEEWSGDEALSVDSTNDEGSSLSGGPLEDGSDGYIDTDSGSGEDDGGTSDEEGTPVERVESDEVESEDEEEVMKQLAALKGKRRRGQEKGAGEGQSEGSAVGGAGQGETKYIPPGLRSKGEGGGGERVLSQLKKKLNGLVNRWVDLWT